jgi:hypothetical protein
VKHALPQVTDSTNSQKQRARRCKTRRHARAKACWQHSARRLRARRCRTAPPAPPAPPAKRSPALAAVTGALPLQAMTVNSQHPHTPCILKLTLSTSAASKQCTCSCATGKSQHLHTPCLLRLTLSFLLHSYDLHVHATRRTSCTSRLCHTRPGECKWFGPATTLMPASRRTCTSHLHACSARLVGLGERDCPACPCIVSWCTLAEHQERHLIHQQGLPKMQGTTIWPADQDGFASSGPFAQRQGVGLDSGDTAYSCWGRLD